METLFVYGTLQDPAVQQRVFGRVVPGQPDSLDGYDRKTLRLSAGSYPIVFVRPGCAVVGLRLAVTPRELGLSDAYETDDYRRVRVRLRSGVEAWVYAE